MKAIRSLVAICLSFACAVHAADPPEPPGAVQSKSVDVSASAGFDWTTYQCAPTCVYVNVRKLDVPYRPAVYSLSLSAYDSSGYLLYYWGDFSPERFQSNPSGVEAAGKITIGPGTIFEGQEAALVLSCSTFKVQEGGYQYSLQTNGRATYGTEDRINFHTSSLQAGLDCKVDVNTVGLSLSNSGSGYLYSSTTINVVH